MCISSFCVFYSLLWSILLWYFSGTLTFCDICHLNDVLIILSSKDFSSPGQNLQHWLVSCIWVSGGHVNCGQTIATHPKTPSVHVQFTQPVIENSPCSTILWLLSKQLSDEDFLFKKNNIEMNKKRREEKRKTHKIVLNYLFFRNILWIKWRKKKARIEICYVHVDSEIRNFVVKLYFQKKIIDKQFSTNKENNEQIQNQRKKINKWNKNSLKHLGQHLSSGGNSGFLHIGLTQLFGLHLISPLSHIHVLQPSSHLSLSSFLLPSNVIHDFLQSHFSRLTIRSSCATSYMSTYTNNI